MAFVKQALLLALVVHCLGPAPRVHADSGYGRITRRKHLELKRQFAVSEHDDEAAKWALLARACTPSQSHRAALVDAATDMLRNKFLALPRKLLFQFSYPDESGNQLNAVVPIVQHLFTVYLITEKPHVRRFLIEVLRAGSSPMLQTEESLETYKMGNARPEYLNMPSGDILATVLDFDMRADIELAEALLSSGYHVGAFYSTDNSGEGASYLGVLQRSHDFAIGPYFEALHRATQSLVQHGNVNNLDEAAVVARLSEVTVPRPGKRKVWSGPQDVYFHSLMNHSHNFRAMIKRLADGVLKGVHSNASYRSDSIAVDNEVAILLLRQIAHARGFNISDVLVSCPHAKANVFHLIAAKNELADFLRELLDIARTIFVDQPSQYVEWVRAAMTSTLAPWGYTALHIAATRWGHGSEMYEELERLDHDFLNGTCSVIRDNFGLTPRDYVTSTYAFVDPERTSDVDPFRVCSSSTEDVLNMPKHPVVPRSTSESAAAAALRRSTVGGDGGWDTGILPTAQLPDEITTLLHQNFTSQIAEVEGLPTLAELYAYMLQQRPVVFRNAFNSGDYFGLQKKWSRSHLLKIHGNVQVDIGEVPFAKQVNVSGAQHKSISLSSWVNSWYGQTYREPKLDRSADPYAKVQAKLRESAKTSIDERPMYLFSAKLLDESQIDVDTEPLQTFLGAVPGVQVMANQFYLGPAGSGAPTHYHQVAVNALAWGEKHWIVSPAKDAERSDVSAGTGLQSRLDRARADPRAIEFIQYSGDLVLLPMDHSHSTFNIRPSVGVASQLNFDPINFADYMEFLMDEYDSRSWEQRIELPSPTDTWSIGVDGVLRQFAPNQTSIGVQ